MGRLPSIRTIRARVDEVNVIFTVTDKHGRFVKNLTKNDFQVVDDKNPDFLNFHDPSRLGMARDGLYQAINENMYAVNFGLLRMRHGDNDTLPSNPGNQYPVTLADLAGQALTQVPRSRVKYDLHVGEVEGRL